MWWALCLDWNNSAHFLHSYIILYVFIGGVVSMINVRKLLIGQETHEATPVFRNSSSFPWLFLLAQF